MNRGFVYVLVATALVAASVGGYYYFARTQVVAVEVPSVAGSATNQGEGTSPAKPKPEHGSFQKRFEPKPPPPNGGKLN